MAFKSNGRTNQQHGQNILQRGPEIKALIAVELGSSWGLPPRQVGEMIGASGGYVATAAKRSDAERAAIFVGEKRLSTFHNLGRVNRAIDRTIKKYGAERVAERALDRMPVAAE
jgi:hypothetical protein